MSDTITIARPYAKAIFESARDAGKLSEWSKLLGALSEIVQTKEARDFLENPSSTEEQHIELLSEPLKKLSGTEYEKLVNFISSMAHNKRLLVLPDIGVLFEYLKAEHEKTLSVKVVSYSKLSSDQEKHLQDSLSKRLNRKVSLDVEIDPSVIGGAIIQAGDLVIDGSVRGKVNKLGTDLVA